MEDIASLWSYQESIDLLKQKLLYTYFELESVRVEAGEEMRKSKEYVKQLVHFLKIACQERDEARDQLQKLLAKVMPSTTPTEFFSTLPPFPPETPLVKPAKANSSITESNSLSETYNYHSHSSSPVNSFFDPVSSPELSNININNGDSSNIAFVNHNTFVQDYNNNTVVPSGVPKMDQASLVIDNLVNGKTLPRKGKLLQAVLGAGPLLDTLLVAGPLPRWRNPPPLQTFHIPPVSINGGDVEIVNQKIEGNGNFSSTHVPKSMSSQSFVEMSCGSSQILSTSMLNFGNGGSGWCAGNGRLISSAAYTNSFVPVGKRQRFQ